MSAVLHDARNSANVLDGTLDAMGEQTVIPIKSQLVFCQAHIAP